MGFKHLVHLISFTWVALRVCRSASDWYLISHSRGPWGQVTLLNRHLPQKCERVPSSSFLYHLDLEAAPLGSVCAGVQGGLQRMEQVLFRPLTAAWRPASCDLSTLPSSLPFLPPSLSLSAEEVQAMTLRLSNLHIGSGRAEADSLALQPHHAVQKYLPQQWGCTVPSWPFHSSLSSDPSIAPSLSPLPVCGPGSFYLSSSFFF